MLLYKPSDNHGEQHNGPWKLNNDKKQGTLRFASEKTQQSNSGKRKFLGKIRAEQALKLIVAASADMIQILESLILAQDES